MDFYFDEIMTRFGVPMRLITYTAMCFRLEDLTSFYDQMKSLFPIHLYSIPKEMDRKIQAIRA